MYVDGDQLFFFLISRIFIVLFVLSRHPVYSSTPPPADPGYPL